MRWLVIAFLWIASLDATAQDVQPDGTMSSAQFDAYVREHLPLIQAFARANVEQSVGRQVFVISSIEAVLDTGTDSAPTRAIEILSDAGILTPGDGANLVVVAGTTREFMQSTLIALGAWAEEVNNLSRFYNSESAALPCWYIDTDATDVVLVASGPDSINACADFAARFAVGLAVEFHDHLGIPWQPWTMIVDANLVRYTRECHADGSGTAFTTDDADCVLERFGIEVPSL